MPAEIINLRRARKTKTRAERETEAATNRHLFGRTKAEKEKDALEKSRAERLIEGHRRENADD